MSEVPESDPLWKKALPDMAPATNNSTHTHHLQLAARKSSLSRVDSSSDKQMRLRRSLSTVVRSVPSSPGETPPFQTHSSLASAEGRPFAASYDARASAQSQAAIADRRRWRRAGAGRIVRVSLSSPGPGSHHRRHASRQATRQNLPFDGAGQEFVRRGRSDEFH